MIQKIPDADGALPSRKAAAEAPTGDATEGRGVRDALDEGQADDSSSRAEPLADAAEMSAEDAAEMGAVAEAAAPGDPAADLGEDAQAADLDSGGDSQSAARAAASPEASPEASSDEDGAVEQAQEAEQHASDESELDHELQADDEQAADLDLAADEEKKAEEQKTEDPPTDEELSGLDEADGQLAAHAELRGDDELAAEGEVQADGELEALDELQGEVQEDSEAQPDGEMSEQISASDAEELASGPVDAPDGAGSRDGISLTYRVEALIFAVSQPIAPVRLARLLSLDLALIKQALEVLSARWADRETAMELVAIAGGYRFMTRPKFHSDLATLSKKAKIEHLSPAALETLSVVAYRQPLCRADIEGIRGVAAGPLLRVLLDRDLIRIAGRSQEPGHPLLYGTTKRFLDHFGLKSLKQLPDIKDLLDVR
ncbi:MAG: segregation and condensation protein B [Pseudohongiellaceae bacterium]|jgi:segregation and condensation protein B